MESFLTFLTFLAVQSLFAYFCYKNGVNSGEERMKNKNQYSFFQGDELAVIVKKKEGHYEVQVVDKDLVKFK